MRRRSSSSSSGPRGRRRRVLGIFLRLAVPAALAGLLLLIWLHVEVGSRFEGRLWDLPSHVYSDRLAIRPGLALRPEELAERLDRCGYARIAGRSGLRPGQYRREGDTLRVHLRAFDAPPAPAPAREAVVQFSGGRVASLRDARGRGLDRADVEPELLATLFGPQQEEREPVPLGSVPEVVVEAVLAAEDSRFFEHWGIDPFGVGRAALANVKSRRISQGGSTITQQTVKNLYLSSERTWWRKVREVPMAILLDLRYPKERILEAYLNEVYLGQRGPVAVCGVQAAARHYFGRDIGDLSLGEAALLAGMIRNPGGTNPFRHPDAARERRGQVLRQMVELGKIEAAAAERAAAEPLHLAKGEGSQARAPYVADLVRSQLSELYPPDVLQEEGLRIYTSLDTVYQRRAEDAVRRGLERLEAGRRRKDMQGAFLAVDPRSGAILALVGGRDYRDTQFNRVIQARRQPGSCFKPFVYLAAFAAAQQGRPGGLTAATLLPDEPLEMRSGGKAWAPENYDRQFRGPVPVRQALEQSLNVPTVVAARDVGLPAVIDTAVRCGLRSDLQPLPSLALGAQEVTPLELAAAYIPLARQGRRTAPWILSEVRDRDGGRRERRTSEVEQAVTPEAAWLVTDVLRGVLVSGTAASARSLGLWGEAAGKTGTTDDTRDSWFVGYTPRLLALAWVGYDDNSRTGLTGAQGALPIWTDFMVRCGVPGGGEGFPMPETILRRTIDPESGQLAVAGCPARLEEVFASGTEPSEDCELHAQGFFRWLKGLFR